MFSIHIKRLVPFNIVRWLRKKGKNVNVFGIQGANFDDAQSQVKRLFLDEELNAYCAETKYSF